MSRQESKTPHSNRYCDLTGSQVRCCVLSLLGLVMIFAGAPPAAAQQRTSDKSAPRAASGKIDSRLAQRIVQQAQATRPDRVPGSSEAESAPQKRPTARVSPASRFASENHESFQPEAAVRQISPQSADQNREAENREERDADHRIPTRTVETRSRVIPASHVQIPATPVQPAPLMPTPSPAETKFSDDGGQTPSEHTQSEQAHNVKSAGYQLAEKPAAVFLDLTETGGLPETVPRSTKDVAPSGFGVGPEVTASESPVHVVMRAVAWVIIALCVFSLGALGVRRWQRQRGLLPTSNSRSRVLETLSLGPGRTVSLIEMAGYRALVASDAGGIRQLVLASSSFSDDFAEMEQDLNTRPAPSTAYQLSDFRSHLPNPAD